MEIWCKQNTSKSILLYNINQRWCILKPLPNVHGSTWTPTTSSPCHPLPPHLKFSNVTTKLAWLASANAVMSGEPHFVTGKADALKCVYFEGPWVVHSTFPTITFIKVKNTAQKPLKHEPEPHRRGFLLFFLLKSRCSTGEFGKIWQTKESKHVDHKYAFLF